MTKQYIYIYRYLKKKKKKERKMCNDSSIIFTQKCSHLYSNLELFLFCLYFFPALLLSFFVPTSTKPTATLRGDGRQSKRLVSIPV